MTSLWQQKNMHSFQDFLLFYNKDIYPTLEGMQKMVDFYQKRGIEMLKLGCTLPILANICLQKSTTAKALFVYRKLHGFIGQKTLRHV